MQGGGDFKTALLCNNGHLRSGGEGGGDSRGKVIVGSECLGSRNLPSGIL